MSPATAAELRRVRALNDRLLARFGPQGWWPVTVRPGEPPQYRPGREGRRVRDRDAFEIMVGAILTQNTAWRNVVLAIVNLSSAGKLTLDALHDAGPWLEELIRPSGYWRQKADRLRRLAAAIDEAGGLARLRRKSTEDLRALFLAWHGVGPETADSFLCYAFARPVFVVDAYTRRLFHSLGLPCDSYAQMQDLVHSALPQDPAILGDFHARIVSNFTCIRGVIR